MVGCAGDGHGEVADTYNGRNDPQGQFGIFQRPPLFDMEFQETFSRQQMGCKGIPFQAGFLEQLGQGTAFCCHETVRIFALEFSGHGLAA